MIKIDHRHLGFEALENLIEHTVAGEGTDYGEKEISFQDKKQQLHRALESNEAVIVYDSNIESCHIISIEQWQEKIVNKNIEN